MSKMSVKVCFWNYQAWCSGSA